MRTVSAAKLPTIVDGVRYEPEEMDRFEGQALYFILDDEAERQGAILAFTTPEGLAEHGRQHPLPRTSRKPGVLVERTHTTPQCSAFNKNVGCDGIDWKILCPPNTILRLEDSWNDRISCAEAGINDRYTVLHMCYNFAYNYQPDGTNCRVYYMAPGRQITDLNTVNFNNIVSSIRFCQNTTVSNCIP